MAAMGIQLLKHQLYLTDLPLADFFLLRRVKEALEGIMLDQKSLKNAWKGITRNITADDFTTAFRLWFEQAKKCIRIGSDFVEKSRKIKIVLPPTLFFLLTHFDLFGGTPCTVHICMIVPPNVRFIFA